MAINFVHTVESGQLLQEQIQGLYNRDASAVVARGAPFDLSRNSDGKAQMKLAWIDKLGLYAPDRATELGGTAFMPDMPPHIDPHPKDRLKIWVAREGYALARFVLDVPAAVLDETNELPDSNYTLLEASGRSPDEEALEPGDAVCFLGSTTLHEFVSIGQRESYINSYRPLTT